MLLVGGLTLGPACRPVLEPRAEAPGDEPKEAWGQLLAEVVTPDGLVDYDLLEERRGALDAYVAWIAQARPDATRSAARQAFFLNAYNALVLYAVLEDGRPASVLDVDGWLPSPGSGFFFERAFRVDGYRMSLWEMEHEQLRGRYQDYRHHAALNCASRSCPPLRDELYDLRGMDGQLRDQMRAWIADDERGVRVEKGVAVFSPIFQWYAWDFDFQTAGDDLCLTASRFAEGGKAAALRALSKAGCPHRFFEYDWSLNDGSGKGAGRAEGGVIRRAPPAREARGKDTDAADPYEP